MRRVPAQPARLRGRDPGPRRRDRNRLLPRGAGGPPSRAPTTSRWSRARSPPLTTPSGSARSGRCRSGWSRSAPAPTAGGIQALRNFADAEEFVAAVYATPSYISTLETSTPISDHVQVDYELQGCPINKLQLLEVLGAYLAGRRPAIASTSVCMECKRAGNVCVMVAHGTPCLGPVTHAGCGALCPSYHRGCYGCYGPMETPNTASLAGWMRNRLGVRAPAARPLVPHLQRQLARLPGGERDTGGGGW